MLPKLIVVAVSLLLVSAGKPAKPAHTPERHLAVGSTFEWQAADFKGVTRLRAGSMHITIVPRKADGFVMPIVRVSEPGLRPVSLSRSGRNPSDLYDNLRIRVGRWDRSGRLFVMLTSFSGGAHCCQAIRLAVPIGSGLKLVDLGERDGDIMRPPRDLDGDGRLDFLLFDDTFLYQFDSYAGSFSPPVVMDVLNGDAVDVSRKPAFRPIFLRAMQEARHNCFQGWHAGMNGYCAGYVAAAARAGLFDQAWKEILRGYNRKDDWYVSGCPPATFCPLIDGYHSFPEALRGFLRSQGYIAR